MKFKVKLLTDTAKEPTKDRYSDAGWDIYADEDVKIYVGETTIVKTGIAIQPDNPDIFRPVFNNIQERSGLASKGVAVGGGVCDQEFTGEYGVILRNLKIADFLDGIAQAFMNDNTREAHQKVIEDTCVNIKKGDKIAQFIPLYVVPSQLEVVKVLDETTRGEKGFGSSGN